ncbi:MAG: hypothetical protein KJP20_01370 [Bacteroidia bacterium]|nr:hypothetical protein [Bacteroidia bacterium]
MAKLLAEPLKIYPASANQIIPKSHDAIKKKIKKLTSVNLRLLDKSSFEKNGIRRNR